MNEDNKYHEDVPGSPTNETDDAALDSLLLKFGGDYNRPPDFVPREEMWHEIRQKTAPAISINHRPQWRFLAAAVLLLGAGISIGVELHSRVGPHATPVGPTPPEVAVTGRPSQAGNGITNPTTTGITSNNTNVVAPQHDVSPPATTQTRADEARGAYASSGSAPGTNGTARSAAYTLATVRHFTAVEALLTSYQTTPHDARGDAQMASWARALLSQTRLLLDSPAAADPARRKLLEDLELVLVQMTQLSPADTPIDREMIDGSVRHNDVITRLRTAVPAGSATRL